MEIKYKSAQKEDASILIDIYNDAFYDDYIKYGECPGYGKSLNEMELSIEKFEKQIIYADNIPVGVISIRNDENGNYYIGCLCIIKKYQRKGLGTLAIKHIITTYLNWKQFSLITPVDEKKINFYTKKCNFKINKTEKDGNVDVVRLYLNRESLNS